MEAIFMLTRDDRTVPNCLEVLDAVATVGLRHIGFKDVGVDRATLCSLARRIRELGATCYLEVVSLEREAWRASVRTALELEVDKLLGGTEVEAVLGMLSGSPISYYPFPGRPVGHPTRLEGDATRIASDCRHFVERGCAGVDLLAYRATEAPPGELVCAARAALGQAELIVAGSVRSAERVRELAEAGVDAFTVGTAVFEDAWCPDRPGLVGQLEAVLAACG